MGCNTKPKANKIATCVSLELDTYDQCFWSPHVQNPWHTLTFYCINQKVLPLWRISETMLIPVKLALQALFWLSAMCVGDQMETLYMWSQVSQATCTACTPTWFRSCDHVHMRVQIIQGDHVPLSPSSTCFQFTSSQKKQFACLNQLNYILLF